ncbi:TPA: hypothetical protein RG678_002274 [Vibrio alginolyticus]|nr:hypothetical protein [Vibrio alginolyticus]
MIGNIRITFCLFVFFCWVIYPTFSIMASPYLGRLEIPLLIIISPLVVVSVCLLNSSLIKIETRYYYYYYFSIFLYLLFYGVSVTLNDVDIDYKSYMMGNFARMLAFFISGVGLYELINSNKKHLKYVFFVTWICIALFVLLNFNYSGLYFPYYEIFFIKAGVGTDQYPIYRHHLTDTFIIISFCILYFHIKSSLIVKSLLIISSMILALMLGGRASIFVFGVLILYSFHKVIPNGYLKVLSYFIILLCAALSITIDFNFNMSSFFSREELFYHGLNDISNNILTGKMAGQMILGYEGLYVHNFISIYRQLGLPCFILYLFLLLSPFYFYFNNKISNEIIIIFSYFVILMIIAKPMFWGWEWIGFGLIVSSLKFDCNKIN